MTGLLPALLLAAAPAAAQEFETASRADASTGIIDPDTVVRPGAG